MSEFVRADKLENMENCSGYKLKLKLLDKRAKIKKDHRRNYEEQRKLKEAWHRQIATKKHFKRGLEHRSIGNRKIF